MTEINCKEVIVSLSDQFVTLQELKDARAADVDCDVATMEVIHRRIADYKNNPNDFTYEKGAYDFLHADDHPVKVPQTNFRLFTGGGLSRASEPNTKPVMPEGGWFQAGAVYTFGSEIFRARGGLLATWSGNKEVGGVGLGPFIGSELHIPALHLMTSIDVISQVVVYPKVAGVDFSPLPLQMGFAWGVMYEGFHRIHFGTSVGFLMQDNGRIKTDKDMAWVGVNFSYLIRGG